MSTAERPRSPGDSGPLYIFRNVFGESRISHQDPSGGVMINKGGLDVFSGHELLHAVSRDNIFYSRGRTYPRDSAAPPNDLRNDLTGGYLGEGLVRSMSLPRQGLEWFLAPTMNRIQWGRIEYTWNGKDLAITGPLVQVANSALAPFRPRNGARLFMPALGTVLGAATEHGARSEGVDDVFSSLRRLTGIDAPLWIKTSEPITETCRAYMDASRLVVMPQSPGAPRGMSFSLSRAVVENGPDKLKLIPQGSQHPPETEALRLVGRNRAANLRQPHRERGVGGRPSTDAPVTRPPAARIIVAGVAKKDRVGRSSIGALAWSLGQHAPIRRMRENKHS